MPITAGMVGGILLRIERRPSPPWMREWKQDQTQDRKIKGRMQTETVRVRKIVGESLQCPDGHSFGLVVKLMEIAG
jgi:hypothetical protein